jgi:hypothetical protein
VNYFQHSLNCIAINVNPEVILYPYLEFSVVVEFGVQFQYILYLFFVVCSTIPSYNVVIRKSLKITYKDNIVSNSGLTVVVSNHIKL